jgi:hypothetical protein
MTGFGMVRPFPGIADSVRVDTAITLPLGVEAYAAFALRAWLYGGVVTLRTRRFAFWSATGSFLLGMAGQVAYHLLVQARAVHARWEVTTLVSCLPVLILGMTSARVHSAALTGITGHVVTVDAGISNGPPGMVLAGLPDTALREARERIRAAISNSGQPWPQHRITVALSPPRCPNAAAPPTSRSPSRCWPRTGPCPLLPPPGCCSSPNSAWTGCSARPPAPYPPSSPPRPRK